MDRKWIFALAGVAGLTALRLRGAKPRDVTAGWPVNFAHRGASALAPENTLEAFRVALDAGAGGLELDVRLTRDGHVVVIHDHVVDRITDGSGPVAEMTLGELRGLDAGYRFDPDGARTYPYRGKGLRVPALAEVLEEFPDVPVNIDIKTTDPGAERAVLGVMRDAGAEGRVLVASSAAHAVVRRFREVSGGRVPTAASRLEIGVFYVLSRLRLERLARPAYDALQVPVSYGEVPLVTPRFVRAANAGGVRVDVWTVDEPDEMRRLLELGAGVIMTNRPGVLAEVLRGRDQATKTSAMETTPKSV